MSNPVVLYGTQSNGETLPVQVDEFGRLVAEGLQGPPGAEGPPGSDGENGQNGGSFPLPPDPYEGALLGWLNNGLAWIGTPPVPIPEGVFGPITAWDGVNGLLTVANEIPAAVDNGVYVWQCDEQGNYFTEGWNVADVWSNNATNSNPNVNSNAQDSFNGSVERMSGLRVDVEEGTETISLSGLTLNNSTVKVYVGVEAGYLKVSQVRIGDQVVSDPTLTNSDNFAINTVELAGCTGTSLTVFYAGLTSGASSGFLYGVEVDGELLVDTGESLNYRVNTKLDNYTMLGVENHTDRDFVVGKYLRIPEQRVAPWVLYGNDPTSLIDQLRQTRD